MLFFLGIVIFAWANTAKISSNPQANNSSQTESIYQKKTKLKMELVSSEAMNNQKTRHIVRASGFSGISKLHFNVICENESANYNDCNRVKTIESLSNKETADIEIVVSDFDFKQDAGNKVKVLASNYELAGIPLSDEEATPRNGEKYYSGEIEFKFNKSIPESKTILQGEVDNYSKISIGMSIDEIESFYAIGKVCEKYAEGESSLGSSFSYKCSLGGKYAHFSFHNGKLYLKQILDF